MNMAMARVAQWLLTRTSAAGAREALIGDLMEEMAHGRSSWWVLQELIGLYGFGFVAQARDSVRITPLFVALVVGLLLAGAASIASLEQVVETWTSVYYLAGTVSLFAHVMSRTTASRTLMIAEGSGLEARDSGFESSADL
jgi:hypothetical protein